MEINGMWKLKTPYNCCRKTESRAGRLSSILFSLKAGMGWVEIPFDVSSTLLMRSIREDWVETATSTMQKNGNGICAFSFDASSDYLSYSAVQRSIFPSE